MNGKSFMDATMFWDRDAMLEFRLVNKNNGSIHPVRYIADPGINARIKLQLLPIFYAHPTNISSNILPPYKCI